jgi:uncharacterized protein YkwD
MLAACGGADGASSGAVTVSEGATPTPTPTPTPTATPTPSPTPTPTPAATPASWAESAAALYDEAPDVTTCNAGVLKESVKADVLDRLNAIRALHGLSPVAYSSDDDAQSAQSALIMAANGELSHTPPTGWRCYSAPGATGASSSNLVGGTVSRYLDWSSEDDFLGMWMTELGGSNLGHRRWMLDPFLTATSYGRVSQEGSDGIRTDAASLKVFGFAGSFPAPDTVPDFVAYPQGDYPARYVDTSGYLSFSVIANKASRNGNGNVDFSKANITMTSSTASDAVTVSNISWDNVGYGIANNLQWRASSLRAGVTYTVRITGVSGAPQSDYSYSFRIVN